MNLPHIIQVAAGVITNSSGHILIAKRPTNKHQGGLWEFPGGKLEAGESAHAALARELEEEVGIRIGGSEPLITITHHYPDKSVRLHVLRCAAFDGEAWGKEGQEIAWTAPAELSSLAFPVANVPIIAAAQLPRRVMITGAFQTPQDLLARITRGIELGAGLVQFRAPELEDTAFIELAKQANQLCEDRQVPMMVNCSPEAFHEIGCAGLHLNAERLRQFSTRPVAKRGTWLSAACHSGENILRAEQLGVDFGYLSPVLATQTHPGASTLGWTEFAALAAESHIPLYGLGGLTEQHLPTVLESGAQGIAAISAFWGA